MDIQFLCVSRRRGCKCKSILAIFCGEGFERGAVGGRSGTAGGKRNARRLSVRKMNCAMKKYLTIVISKAVLFGFLFSATLYFSHPSQFRIDRAIFATLIFFFGMCVVHAIRRK